MAADTSPAQLKTPAVWQQGQRQHLQALQRLASGSDGQDSAHLNKKELGLWGQRLCAGAKLGRHPPQLVTRRSHPAAAQQLRRGRTGVSAAPAVRWSQGTVPGAAAFYRAAADAPAGCAATAPCQDRQQQG